MSESSRRQRLLELAETGRLRQILEYASPGTDTDVIDLIVDICLRYAESRRAAGRGRPTRKP